MGRKLTDEDVVKWFKDNEGEYKFMRLLKSEGSYSRVVLKCNKCGNEFEKSYQQFRYSTIRSCDDCARKNRKESQQTRRLKESTVANALSTNENSEFKSKFYVYRFLDGDDNVIYIGRTNNLVKRMKEHFSENGHLPSECYESVVKVEFIILNNEIDMNIYELYYINLFKPYYNTKDKKETDTEVNLPSKVWRIYIDHEHNENTYSFNLNLITSLKNEIRTMVKYKSQKILNNEVVIIDYAQWTKKLESISNEINNIESLLLNI